MHDFKLPFSQIKLSSFGRHDTQNKGTNHNDTQHNNINCDTAHYWKQSYFCWV